MLSKEDDDALRKYILEMAKIELPLIPNQVKEKVAEITQERPTSFTEGMLERSWLKWFLHRHPKISLKSLQGLMTIFVILRQFLNFETFCLQFQQLF